MHFDTFNVFVDYENFRLDSTVPGIFRFFDQEITNLKVAPLTAAGNRTVVVASFERFTPLTVVQQYQKDNNLKDPDLQTFVCFGNQHPQVLKKQMVIYLSEYLTLPGYPNIRRYPVMHSFLNYSYLSFQNIFVETNRLPVQASFLFVA